ncbi:DUF4843 domain-containing protein [Pedobacter sp. GR22-6]|uniref:DUF4843 domain-containing protein n=1 Tax=Pedobacter sp. GR22-6 TaxID=3127957 RepID=UPI00307F5461
MRYLIAIALACLLFACKKEEVPFYSEKDGIAFYTSTVEGADSTSYSFAFNVTPKVRDTVYFNMRVVGRKTDHDRIVKVVAGPGTTARLGVDFLLPETKLPAGKLELKYPIILLNSSEMTTRSFDIVADAAENNDFILGAIGQLPVFNNTTTINKLRVKVSVTNRLIQPAYWPGVQGIFGAFSQIKLKFMIGVLGMSDFSTLTVDQQFNLPVKLRQALADYEATNGPLIDENGLRVTF